MIGYNVIQPNGKVYRLRAESMEDRQELVRTIAESWKEYCDGNWLSGKTEDQFCPENKVKLFLDGLGYFLILGDTDGIETDYKKVVRGSRELPMSSCPSYIEDEVYGSTSTIARIEEEGKFESVLDNVDAKAEKLGSYYKKPPAKKPRAKKEKTRFQRYIAAMKALGISREGFSHVPVDVDGGFTFDGRRYVVSAEQYLPVSTGDGDKCFFMDRIICANSADGVHFYDMSMKEVSEFVEKNF